MTERIFKWQDRLYEKILHMLMYLGGLVDLGTQLFTRGFRRPFEGRQLIYQLETVGVESIAIAVLTAIFSSMVLTIQLAVQLEKFGAKTVISKVIGISLIRELGPVLTGLMVGGRVGAGIAAELGSMNVTEQIDAMRSMGADPVRKLVIPRVVAAVIILPLLTTLATLLGLGGAMIIGWFNMGINPNTFWRTAIHDISLEDFLSGFLKPIFFGFFISLIACYQGLRTTGGTEQVGDSTTQTVVFVSIVTLIADFILTNLLLGLGL